MFVFVVVTEESDVGRPGAVKLFVEESSGQTSLPQARFVGQQPPPKVDGQERKPEEHCRVFGVEVGGGVVLGDEVEVVEDELLVMTAGMIVVVVSVVSVTVEIEVDRGCVLEEVVDVVGTITTTVVMTCIQPTSSHAYPGKQHPPPESCGQLV